MIHLYKISNTEYTKNGDFVLHPISASIHLILNGAWSASFQCPLDEMAPYIQNDAVIKFDLPKFKNQLWVITDPKKTDFETIDFTAYPIFLWDAQKELIMRDCRPTNMSGKDALKYMLQGCNASEKYKVVSDISKSNTAYYINKNFIEALNSSDENAFTNRWGGEAIFDNYTLHMNQQAGSDRGFVISATKNISGFNISEDDSEFCNVIIPIGFNGWTSKKDVKDNDRVSRIDHKKFVQYDYIKWWEDASEEDYSSGDIVVCRTEKQMEDALTAAATRDFEKGNYRTRYSYDIDFVDLRGYDLYRKFAELEYVWLGDRVDVKNLDAMITTKQVVTELEYDLVEDEITRLILGSSVENFFTQSSITTSTLKKVVDSGSNTVIASTIKGVIDMMSASLKAQKNGAQRQDTRAILFEDLMEDSPTFGALCLGTQGIQISKQRNADNTDWIWGTCIDYQSIIADYIITGTLSGKNGNFWLNLDDGSYELGDKGLFKGTITTTKDANIGRALFLDTENTGNPNEAASGVYLGSESMGLQNPRLQLWSVGGWKFAFLGTEDVNKDPHVRADKNGPGGSSAELYCSDDVCLSMNDFNTIFKSKRIDVEDTGKNKSGTGLTYEGSVSGITTVNGFVTGVTP
ncbi:phage tail spike protein [Dubosiella newyorkensis]|uniref:phage tail spike protein n=1 Tax=Dubosiella newyorkensis TaxID=1862672 RepID=UPI00272DC7C3|nr:phage tail spike protein [Dubosiella newyorkensis]